MKTKEALFAVVLLLLAVPAPARSEENSAERLATPPRLSLLEGEVSFWRAGAEDWAPARLNVALAPGDQLYTAADAHLEVQIGGYAWVRAAGETTLGLENLEPDFVQFRLGAGQAMLDLRQLAPGTTVELDTPAAVLTIDRAGYYRVDVLGEEVRFMARRGGSATVRPADGSLAVLSSGSQVTLRGTDQARVDYGDAPQLDALDGWSYGRTDRLLQGRSQDLPADMYGVDELNSHGDWRVVPSYGRVWVPRKVAPGWVPYSTGRWMWDAYYGWTWVDEAPWGWAPFHYGRWVYVDSYWAWTPGPVVVAPVYAPALVAFFDTPRVYVGIATPGVAWVALGWGEPLIPWWGSVGFVGVPWWGGWYGPHVVNRVVVHHTHVVHAHDVRRYEHAGRHGGVVSRRGHEFGHGPAHRLRPDQRLTPIHGRPDVRPRRGHLAPAEGPARRPPDQVRRRSVVSTRAPRDPVPRLRGAGLDVTQPDRIPSRVIGPRPGDRGPDRVQEPRGRVRERYVEKRGYSPSQPAGERPGPHQTREREAPGAAAPPNTVPRPPRVDREQPVSPPDRRGEPSNGEWHGRGAADRPAPPLSERPRAPERRRFQEPRPPRSGPVHDAAPAPAPRPAPQQPGSGFSEAQPSHRAPRSERPRARERRQPAGPADGGASGQRAQPQLSEHLRRSQPAAQPRRESVTADAERPRAAEGPRFSRPRSEPSLRGGASGLRSRDAFSTRGRSGQQGSRQRAQRAGR